MFVPQTLILLSFCMNSSPSGRWIGLISSFLIFIWQTTLMAGCTNNDPFSFAALKDALSAHIVVPFSTMGTAAKAAFISGKKKEHGTSGGFPEGMYGKIFFILQICYMLRHLYIL